VTGGKIDQFAEDVVTQLLVEAWRLEGKGIQEDIFHAAATGFLFRAEEQLFPIPLPAQVLADVHEADGQPAVIGIADHAAESLPGFIPEGDTERRGCIAAGVGKVERSNPAADHPPGGIIGFFQSGIWYL